MMEVGIRVIRGPDWRWGAQDNGDGHVGTVVEIGKVGSQASPEKTVVVQWDYGYRTNYRVGYQNGYDLLVVDNAPAGVKHQNIICDECQKLGIAGLRWKCVSCFDYDLCTLCYMGDKHDLHHVFQRFETAESVGVEMTHRKNGERVQLKGIFVGAKVVRGIDWDWGDQDGGEGKTGRVIDIKGWDNESSRSVANVTWTSGTTNVYRMGHKGKIDLRYTQEAIGGSFYRDHLPVLGKEEEAPALNKSAMFQGQGHLTFNVGDKVKVLMEFKALRQIQEGHGGWNQKMGEYIGEIGTVHRVTDKGDIRVQYEGGTQRWTYHPGALTKVYTFAVGDIVCVSDDVAHVKEHQEGHGEWIDVMRVILGKMGKVTKIYSDGDLRVTIDGQTWTLSPLCVHLMPGSATELNNTLQTDEQEKRLVPAVPHTPVQLLDPMVVDHILDRSGIHNLVQEAAAGNFNYVCDFLIRFPEKVNESSNNKTCLQVAAHQGHLELVNLLIESGSMFEITDEVGDTALHYSAFGNQAEVMELLIQKGADLNAVNVNNCTTLHIATNKQNSQCVEILLRYRCNVNIQDSYGDTSLHDAIGKEDVDIVDMLCSSPGIDFTTRNKRGFNVLHYAALKGNTYAIEKLLTRTRQLVDVKKDDGFAALHLASLNGHRAIIDLLLVAGQADIDQRNNRRQTPLILAVSQNHSGVVELLVSMGANAAISDEDGDTALHIAVVKMSSSVPLEIPSEMEAPTIHGIYKQLQNENNNLPVTLATACYLIQECDVDLTKKNRKDKSPLDIVKEIFPDSTVVSDILIKHFREALKRQSIRPVPQLLPPSLMPLEECSTSRPRTDIARTSDLRTECLLCLESGQNVSFEPCGDSVVCEECAVRMKKCLRCHQPITRKVTKDGRVIQCKERQASAERVKYLESKIAEIEETHSCSICMERHRNVAFLCGHSACDICAKTLKTCHMCRKNITKKINLY